MRVSLCSLNILLRQKVSRHIEITLSRHFSGSWEDEFVTCLQHLGTETCLWATGNKRHQGTNHISRLPPPFFSSYVFLNPPSSILRKETQLDKHVSHQAIRVFVKWQNQTILFHRELCWKVTFLYKLDRVSPSHVCFLCDHCRGGRRVKVIQRLEPHPRLCTAWITVITVGKQ